MKDRFGVVKALGLLVEKQLRDAKKPKYRLLVDGSGKPMFHTVRDRLGDIIRIYRAHPIPNRYRPKYDGEALRAIRAEKGCGRPPLGFIPVPISHEQEKHLLAAVSTESYPYRWALSLHGSQRAAARALGLNLSTFQRRLAKEQAAA